MKTQKNDFTNFNDFTPNDLEFEGLGTVEERYEYAKKTFIYFLPFPDLIDFCQKQNKNLSQTIIFIFNERKCDELSLKSRLEYAMIDDKMKKLCTTNTIDAITLIKVLDALYI